MSAEGGDESEKSFEPTQRRLDEARKRGEIPQSNDLVTAAAYGGFVLAVSAFGAGSLLAMGATLGTFLAQADPLAAQAFAGSPHPIWAAALGQAVSAFWPWFVLPAGASLLCLLAQQGLVVAPDRLAPKLSRISPLAVAGQKFGLHGLVEFAKGLIKVALYGTVLGLGLVEATPRLVGTVREAPPQAVLLMFEIALALLGKVAAVAVVLGIGDLLWQRLSFQKRLMMSRQEMTEETKDSEGDPHVKQQRRQRGMSIAMNRMLNDVPEASVVVVNPTHYAVALKWDRARGGAPVCVAKGVDEMAARIRERAMAAGVPIRRDPPTARAIYASVEIGQEVARPEWRAVAAAIRFAERLRAKAQEGSR
ncbi:EscU/YscU/HrcU family type III secretion system export apparatus switch protein [Rubellimicrobium aerolatum]|uniref:Flagellar biosynthesis protein FlhB n=1 Tax=Rubellimicrobium aerolatum TaxID=490979 RepID=A0ABW0S9T8_9RHOB|nr:flagellar type III secretion system protein FlhB [Rubellimicrobium aerolatum]MBP1805075.1 flagellar biosynthetic protein FlhB [Rubellimicrobium aerolatum]